MAFVFGFKFLQVAPILQEPIFKICIIRSSQSSAVAFLVIGIIFLNKEVILNGFAKLRPKSKKAFFVKIVSYCEPLICVW